VEITGILILVIGRQLKMATELELRLELRLEQAQLAKPEEAKEAKEAKEFQV